MIAVRAAANYGVLVLSLWRKIRATGRVAEPAPPRPGGPVVPGPA